MKKSLLLSVMAATALVAPLFAHRLDEYLQAALLSVEKDQVRVEMRLVPGVAVAPQVLAMMDTDRNGLISPGEQRSYAEKLAGDLRFSLDGRRLSPRITSFTFPPVADMKQGIGQIQVAFTARVPNGSGKHKLKLENRHASSLSVYLMNSLRPQDQTIQITQQERNRNQSIYDVAWSSGGANPNADTRIGFGSIFRLGVRHIAEGSDHLLFLLTLLLPAPLLAQAGRWSRPTTVKHSLTEVLKIVTAFTLGHSCTLALAGMGLVHAPAKPIEILIAVSIFVSALHAVRPLFPGREAGVAAFFGLIHGLAFATTIMELGLGRWERVMSIFAFNLGIEAMQLVVVLCALPSLILLSRTAAYSMVRLGGAALAGLAASGWIAERAWGMRMPVDWAVEQIVPYAGWLAIVLFLAASICRRLDQLPADQTGTKWTFTKWFLPAETQGD